jgi:hypothetical protein
MRRRAAVAVLAVLAGVLSGGAADARADVPADLGCSRLVPFDPADFGPDSADVTNRMLPLQPGAQRVFKGRSATTGEDLPHSVTFTVTGLTKVVGGVKSVVVWDVDEVEDEVSEAELAFFAQDRAGNVWNLGEYPEQYTNGEYRGAPFTWMTGVGDAEPGIHMPASPALSMPEYVQGSVPSIRFLDCATVFQTGASVCPPVGCFSGVLVTHERSPLEPGSGTQVKYHAPDVGIVQIGAIDDPEAETLVLAEEQTLAGAELAEANRAARMLDARGRQCEPAYIGTPPAEGPDQIAATTYTCPAAPVTEVVTGPAPFSPPPVPPPPAATATAVESPGVPTGRISHGLMAARGTRTVLTGPGGVRAVRHVRRFLTAVSGRPVTAVDTVVRRHGRVLERSVDYLVQDPDGSVWRVGHRTAGPGGDWTANRDGAQRALYLPATPTVGQAFRATQAPGHAADRTTVEAVGESVGTPGGRFDGCVRLRVAGGRGAPDRTQVQCPGAGLVRDGRLRLTRMGPA